MTLQQLIDKRNNVWQQAKDIQDKAEAEGRQLTAEEKQNINKAFDEMDDLKEQIAIAERAANIATEMNQSKGTQAGGKQNPEGKTGEGRASQDYRNAFLKQLRYTKNELDVNELRQLNVGTGEEGGYLVPDEFERTLVQALEEENIMRSLATIIQTSSGTREIPVVTDRGTAFWTAEKGDYDESEHAFDQETLGAYKLTTLMKVTEELLNDSAFNLEAYIASQYAVRIGAKEEEAFVAGDGDGKPTGLLESALVGKTTAAATALTADEIIELYHSLRRPYRSRSSFMMHDTTALAVRLLKAQDDQYIWQPGMQAGQPDRLLGRPVFISDNVEQIGAANKIMAFGDFSYYWIADRTGTAIQRLNELYAANGMIGFRAYKRVDGKLILPEAVKLMVCDDGL